MKFNFIGSDCTFNNKLQKGITVDSSYTVVSNVDGDYITGVESENIILIAPISSEEQYFEATKHGFMRMKDTNFNSTNLCTTIFVYMHEFVDINHIIDTINSFDKINMVDNIWIYPKMEKYQVRSDFIPDLPWQKKQKPEFYIKLRGSKYISESLIHFGMIIQNDKYNVIKQYDNQTKIPYTVITEGIMFPIQLAKDTRAYPNVRIYHADQLVYEKMTTENGNITEFRDSPVYDYYAADDRTHLDSYITKFETTRKIYLSNTESVTFSGSTAIAGLSSGNILAKLAFENKLKHVIFFDYSQASINFQRDLMSSTDRKLLYANSLDNMTLGFDDATVSDLNSLNMSDIDMWYDYLCTINVEFVNIDLRIDEDIERLFELMPNDSTLWISNVLCYITSMRDYSTDVYKLIDSRCHQKNITVLPHTRIYYES